MHRTRQRDRALIVDLASQGRLEEVYRRSVLWDFAVEARMGFQLAFLRPFAVPRMAKVLVDTGRITADPERRSYNTGILIHELIAGGLGDSRSRQVIRHMNRAHRAPGICQEDLSYVLAAFIVVPSRYIEHAGWRPLLDIEKDAAVTFFSRLGKLMAIDHIPASYAAAEDLLDRYEATMVAPSTAGRLLGKDIVDVLRRRLPAPVRSLAGPLFASQLRDERILDALAIDGGPQAARAGIEGMMSLAARARAHRPAPAQPSFTPGQPAGRIYSQGYSLDDVAPH